ncbi:MAG: hypothetical protein JWQ10_2928 [Herbaspirillum sp.]|jgi:OOP family OmpA-OmpF porin|nr:hypothetical protein [Herbaspirillum sp.]
MAPHIDNHQGEILEKVAFKYCISGLVLCAAAVSASAFAAAPANDGWYLGTSVGRSKVKINRDGLYEDFKGNKTGTGFKLYGGYQFNQYFALEGQYIKLATAKYQSSGPSTPWHGNLKIRGLAIDAVGILPLGDSFSLLGKLGMVQMQADANFQTNSGSSYSGKTTKTTPLIGVGAEYKLTPALALRAEYEYFGSLTPSFDPAAKISTDMMSIGLRYTF